MKNQTIDTDYTDEKFKIGERNYYLYSDLDSPEFHVVALYESSRELLAVIHKKPCTLPGIKAVFESEKRVLKSLNLEDRAAISASIDFLEKKYQ